MLTLLILGGGAAFLYLRSRSTAATVKPVIQQGGPELPGGFVPGSGTIEKTPIGPIPPVRIPAQPNPALVTPLQTFIGRVITRTTQPALSGSRAMIVESGGGGPENLGATSVSGGGDVIDELQHTSLADKDYIGFAAPSRNPVTAGGGLGQPADGFRWLGDRFGARQ